MIRQLMIIAQGKGGPFHSLFTLAAGVGGGKHILLLHLDGRPDGENDEWGNDRLNGCFSDGRAVPRGGTAFF